MREKIIFFVALPLSRQSFIYLSTTLIYGYFMQMVQFFSYYHVNVK
jgi:hypothetical protein